jgi:hypothetical protein
MATSTTPAPATTAAPITISLIGTPLSADVQAICAAVTACFNFASTPVGQKLVQAELDAGKAIDVAITDTFAKVFAFFHNLFHPGGK